MMACLRVHCCDVADALFLCPALFAGSDPEVVAILSHPGTIANSGKGIQVRAPGSGSGNSTTFAQVSPGSHDRSPRAKARMTWGDAGECSQSLWASRLREAQLGPGMAGCFLPQHTQTVHVNTCLCRCHCLCRALLMRPLMGPGAQLTTQTLCN